MRAQIFKDRAGHFTVVLPSSSAYFIRNNGTGLSSAKYIGKVGRGANFGTLVKTVPDPLKCTFFALMREAKQTND